MIRTGLLEIFDHLYDTQIGGDSRDQVDVIFSAADGVNMDFDFGRPVNDESVQFGFKAGYQ
jgi:hypothetical protein